MKSSTAVLVTCVFVLFSGLGQAQDPAAIEKASADLDGAQSHRRSLETEMIRAYRKLETDFKRLRGADGDKLRFALAAI